VLTVAGGALVLSGLTVGSALARGQLLATPGSTEGTITLFAAGAALGLVGVPILSSGTFTTKQLLRTIKGAEKVPRTVANEQRYWDAYLQRQFGQALTIGGGADLLLGVLGLVVVGATVGTDFYKDWYWAVAASPFALGAAMIAGGISLQRSADKKMEAVRDEVDPLRQKSGAGGAGSFRPGLPSLSMAWSSDGSPRVVAGWGFSF